jgi:hypothetical protein
MNYNGTPPPPIHTGTTGIFRKTGTKTHLLNKKVVRKETKY